MKVRTAVGLVIAIVVAKAALTWLALQAWASLPERPGFVGHWHIELGTVGEWLAAFFTAGAAIVALWIAGSDRRARRRERDDADLAQARLIREEIERERNAQDFTLRIRNYGALGILDVWLEEAAWVSEPEARWKDNNELVQIVPPFREGASSGKIRVSFVDADGNPFPNQIGKDPHGNEVFAETRGSPEVVYTFMDANGKRWRSGTAMETPERVTD